MTKRRNIDTDELDNSNSGSPLADSTNGGSAPAVNDAVVRQIVMDMNR